MAQLAELEIQKREVMGKASRRLRKEGQIPGNIYGHKEDSRSIQIEAASFDRFQRTHGANGLVSLRVPGETGTEMVLIRKIQRDPRSGKILHVDFFRVSQTEMIKVRVPLHFEGEAPGVKVLGGVLLHIMDALDIESPAQDLPDRLNIDIAELKELDSQLHASDVKLPPNVTLLTDPTEIIAKIEAPRTEAVEETAETPAAAAPAPEAASN